VKLNDWIEETVELQFVAREENGEPQKIRGNLESVGDRGVMLSYDETPRGRLSSTPGTRSSGWRKYETERPIHPTS
jgi:hypothetical protein